jgi:hypothetical protein
VADKTKTGGPAFPAEQWSGGDPYNHAGMTLRDYFAGQALASGAILKLWINEYGEDESFNAEVDDWAAIAYSFADAMIAQRTKERES